MVRGLKLRKAGDSVAVTLPKDIAERLHLEGGDSVFAIETEYGILLTPYGSDVEEALSITAEISDKYRNALRELAK